MTIVWGWGVTYGIRVDTRPWSCLKFWRHVPTGLNSWSNPERYLKIIGFAGSKLTEVKNSELAHVEDVTCFKEDRLWYYVSHRIEINNLEFI